MLRLYVSQNMCHDYVFYKVDLFATPKYVLQILVLLIFNFRQVAAHS